MEVERQRKLLMEVFGESSDSKEEDEQLQLSSLPSSSSSPYNQSVDEEHHKQLLKDVFGGSSDIETEGEEETTELSFSPPDSQSIDEEFQKQLLKDVFGGSSDSEAGEFCSSPTCRSINGECGLILSPLVANPSRRWQRIEAINGLWLCRDFLSPQQQSSLLDSIQAEGWFAEASQNQAMRFGDLPFWAIELSDHIQEVVHAGDRKTDIGMLNLDNEACVLPSLLLWRDPFFDQFIVNVYQPGEGICAHVDLMRFDDGIAIVSLESPCVMHFSPAEKDGEEVPPAMKIPVCLNPGSLAIMWGNARYSWKHEINRKLGFQVWEGQEIEQKRRTSVTLRKLRVSE